MAKLCATLRLNSLCSPISKRATGPVMVGHRLMGMFTCFARETCRRPRALRSGDSRFMILLIIVRWRRGSGQDLSVGILDISVVDPVVASAIQMLRSHRLRSTLSGMRARSVKLPTLMYALLSRACDQFACRKLRGSNRTFSTNSSLWRTKKAALFWRINEQCCKVVVLTLTGNASDAIQMHHHPGITALRSIGATVYPFYLPCSRSPMLNSGNSMKLGAALARL